MCLRAQSTFGLCSVLRNFGCLPVVTWLLDLTSGAQICSIGRRSISPTPGLPTIELPAQPVPHASAHMASSLAQPAEERVQLRLLRQAMRSYGAAGI